MDVFALEDLDYDTFVLVGVYPSLERAKGAAEQRGLLGGVFHIEQLTVGDVNQNLPYWSSKDGKTWTERSRH